MARAEAQPRTPARTTAITVDLPDKVVGFPRTTELDDAERASPDRGVTVRHGPSCTWRVSSLVAAA